MRFPLRSLIRVPDWDTHLGSGNSLGVPNWRPFVVRGRLTPLGALGMLWFDHLGAPFSGRPLGMLWFGGPFSERPLGTLLFGAPFSGRVGEGRGAKCNKKEIKPLYFFPST